MSELKPIPMDLTKVAPHIYVVLVSDKKRDSLMQYLKDRNIETGIPYTPNHLHSFYKKDNLNLPITEQAFEKILALPLHVELSSADVNYILNCVQNFYTN